MRYQPIPATLFAANRQRLAALLPDNALAVVNSNDFWPTNADGVLGLAPNSDLFYLTGVEQEETRLLVYPGADDEKHRELLFLRQPTEENELWEGRKLTKEAARKLTGIANIHWLSEFPRLFHRLMCECGPVFLNTNEHKRAVIDVESREARFVADTMHRYPVHDYRRLAPLLHQLRAVKSEEELKLIRQACDITRMGFQRVLRFTRPGVKEYEVKAEFAHEFIRNGGEFAYPPIVASGANACCLHYMSNDQVCRAGNLLLLDVASAYANYNSDLTRTIPVSGRFTPRQKKVYNAVLGVFRQQVAGLVPGKKIKDWQKEAESLIERALVNLGLLTTRQIKNQDPEKPAFKKYFPHGCGHPIGLDVHDVGLTVNPMEAGWVMTVEPGIYIPEEGLGVRLENDVLITARDPVDLMANIPIEIDEIEALMHGKKKLNNGAIKALPRRTKNRLLAAAGR